MLQQIVLGFDFSSVQTLVSENVVDLGLYKTTVPLLSENCKTNVAFLVYPYTFIANFQLNESRLPDFTEESDVLLAC